MDLAELARRLLGIPQNGAHIALMGADLSRPTQAVARDEDQDSRVAMLKLGAQADDALQDKAKRRLALDTLVDGWTPDYKLPLPIHYYESLVELGLAEKQDVLDRDNKLIVSYTRYRRTSRKAA